MIKVQVDTSTATERAIAISRQLSQYAVMTRSPWRERYYSPDMKKCLLLKYVDEIRFGPAYYTATLHKTREAGDLHDRPIYRMRWKRALSPGIWWRHTPWSSDSNRVVITTLECLDVPQSKAYMISVAESKREEISIPVTDDSRCTIWHHQWSPDNKNCLLLGCHTSHTACYMYSAASKKTTMIHAGKRSTRHCYFGGQGEYMIKLNDDGLVNLVSTDDTTIIAEATIRSWIKPQDRVSYSFFDKDEQQMLLAINADPNRFHEANSCDKWLSIKIRE